MEKIIRQERLNNKELINGKIIKCCECGSDNIERLDYNILANSRYRCIDCGYFLDSWDDLPDLEIVEILG